MEERNAMLAFSEEFCETEEDKKERVEFFRLIRRACMRKASEKDALAGRVLPRKSPSPDQLDPEQTNGEPDESNVASRSTSTSTPRNFQVNSFGDDTNPV